MPSRKRTSKLVVPDATAFDWIRSGYVVDSRASEVTPVPQPCASDAGATATASDAWSQPSD